MRDNHFANISVEFRKVIDQEKSQIAREAKEAIHIRKVDPELNRNVGRTQRVRNFNSKISLGVKEYVHTS